jgi:hypothetical protein
MHISSRDFIGGQMLPFKCTNEGDNVNPSLVIQEVPPASQSLVVIMRSSGLVQNMQDDGQGKVHWIVWNIPPQIGYIPSGIIPKGAIVGINDYWEVGYGGPYPPAGECHKYKISVYALDTSLNLSSSTTNQQLLKAIETHILDQDEIIGFYQRK